MKTWLITGCSSGFGKNLAETLLSEGEQVVVTARKPETIQHFAEKYPQTALCLRLDVTKKVKISDLSKVDMKWCDMGRACKLITDIIQRPDTPHHILLGSMAVGIGEKFVKDRAEEIQKWKEASESLDA